MRRARVFTVYVSSVLNFVWNVTLLVATSVTYRAAPSNMLIDLIKVTITSRWQIVSRARIAFMKCFPVYSATASSLSTSPAYQRVRASERSSRDRVYYKISLLIITRETSNTFLALTVRLAENKTVPNYNFTLLFWTRYYKVAYCTYFISTEFTFCGCESSRSGRYSARIWKLCLCQRNLPVLVALWAIQVVLHRIYLPT